MSGVICVLTSAILRIGAIGVIGLSGPPALPPEAPPSSDPPASTDAPPPEPPSPPNPDAPPEPPPDAPVFEPPRTSLPPGLQPVPFPLEQQRRSDVPPPTQGSDSDTLAPPAVTPMPQRRSIVDLRDPFDRPPPTRSNSERTAATRLLMPDLKDPFAPGLRRVRSKRLDMVVPNDIRDPFRDRPPGEGPRSPCARTTADGTVVQSPGAQTDCPVSPIDLRDPFTTNQVNN